MELNRFKQLLESTMGNVKPLIMEQQTTQNPNITQLVNKLKEIPFYQEADNLRVDGNRVYYTGNINSTTVTDRQGNVNQKKSQVGTNTKATDPNARFFEWTGTGWKRGEQQNKYYDAAALDLNTALTDYAKLSLPQQPSAVDNVASTK